MVTIIYTCYGLSIHNLIIVYNLAKTVTYVVEYHYCTQSFMFFQHNPPKLTALALGMCFKKENTLLILAENG